jgi:radical SAM protein with 4Fe4S-binding SPASM domain
MTLLRQSRNTYIRRFKGIGYIVNQLTGRDRVYDEAGSVFLGKIDRIPRNIDSIVDEIFSKFVDISKDELESDFMEFVNDLENDQFFVTGDSEYELNSKDQKFSYNDHDLREIKVNFLQQEKSLNFSDTSDFFSDYFRENPTIFGMHIEVTSRCNEHCIHCYTHNENKNSDMDVMLAMNILDQLKKMGTLSITFSGGEPFLHPRFSEILDHARKNDFLINILSNGTVISEDLMNKIKELNVNKIQISLYSMIPDIHDSITRLKGSHEKTIQAIERLIKFDIPVQISCPIMKENKNSYKEISIWCKDRKIRALSDFILMAKCNFDTSNLDQRLSLEETKSLVKTIIDVEEEYRQLLEIEPKSIDMEKFANQPVCGVGVDNACISFDGSVYPCSGFQGLILGNANKQSLFDIWKNSENVKFLRSIKNSSFPQCLKCDARDYCAMCLVRNHNEGNGDVFRVNKHYCDVAFLTKELVKKTL